MYLAHLYIKFHSPSLCKFLTRVLEAVGFFIMIIFSVRHSFVLLSLEVGFLGFFLVLFLRSKLWHCSKAMKEITTSQFTLRKHRVQVSFRCVPDGAKCQYKAL